MTEEGRRGIVYSLSDPRNGLVRYVGATKAPMAARMSSHLANARRSDHRQVPPVALWIRELLAEDLHPVARELHRPLVDDLDEMERQEIGRHFDDGWPLTNVRDFPGAFHAYNPQRKLAAARRRASRLADIGGEMLSETLEELTRLEAEVRDLEARAALAALRRPTEVENFDAAIRLLLHDWNEEEIGYTGAPPATEQELEALASILLELAVVGHRRGVEFGIVVSSVGRRMLRELRFGALLVPRPHGEVA